MTDLESVQSESSPERFEPADMSGGLMEAEHRARYWWATQWVAGKHVLDAGCGSGYGTAMLAAGGPETLVGADISEEALADARGKVQEAAELVRADIRDLPFDSESFDVVTCFEVIEHVDRQPEALAELKRVLRAGGVLLISSPNRDVYTPGNPHHVREYTPQELRAELEIHFQNVELHRQHPRLASALLPDEALDNGQPEQVLGASVGQGVEPGSETYTIGVASDSAIANPAGIVVIGSDFDVRWWHEQVDRLGRAEHESARTAAELSQEVARLSRRLLEREQTAARALELEHSLDELEAQHAELAATLGHCERVIDDMKGSTSWKLTSPLRRVRALFKRSGRGTAP